MRETMTFPGLTPTFVMVPLLQPELKELDHSRSAILVNLKTLECIQSEKGGTSEKSPKDFIDFRDLSEEKFEGLVKQLVGTGMPERMIQSLREYRARTSKAAS